jgi:hypothetical protein
LGAKGVVFGGGVVAVELGRWVEEAEAPAARTDPIVESVSPAEIHLADLE